MLQKLKVTSYAFIYFLMFGFSLGIPSPGFTQTDHTSTYTPNIAVGPHLLRALSTGGGNGDYILYGRDETQDWCERLLFKETSDLRLGVEVIHIQYSKQFCYYYGAETAGAKNAGVGGPHIWTYAYKFGNKGGHVVTHTPGETVGPSAFPPIKYEWFADPKKVFDRVDEPHRTRCEMLLAGYTLSLNSSLCYERQSRVIQRQGYGRDCPEERHSGNRRPSQLPKCKQLRVMYGVDVPTCEARELNITHLSGYLEGLVTEGHPDRQAHYKHKLGGMWRGGLGLGTSIRYIQYTGGYCYYYQGGTSSGRSGPETWRYDPE